MDDAYLPGGVSQRHARLGEPHIAPLEELRRLITRETGRPVPAFDPDSGGVAAEALFLLRDPSSAASGTSRMITIDNNDPTARNNFCHYEAVGLDRRRALHWNAVPWEVAGESWRKHSKLAQPYTESLLKLLPRLRAIVVMGTPAQEAWDTMAANVPSGAEVIRTPHPGPPGCNHYGADGIQRSAHVRRGYERLAQILG